MLLSEILQNGKYLNLKGKYKAEQIINHYQYEHVIIDCSDRFRIANCPSLRLVQKGENDILMRYLERKFEVNLIIFAEENIDSDYLENLKFADIIYAKSCIPDVSSDILISHEEQSCISFIKIPLIEPRYIFKSNKSEINMIREINNNSVMCQLHPLSRNYCDTMLTVDCAINYDLKNLTNKNARILNIRNEHPGGSLFLCHSNLQVLNVSKKINLVGDINMLPNLQYVSYPGCETLNTNAFKVDKERILDEINQEYQSLIDKAQMKKELISSKIFKF